MFTAAFFIDGAYLDHVLQNTIPGQKVDYLLLVRNVLEAAGKELELLRIYYYHCLPYQGHPPTLEQAQRVGRMQSFFRALQRTSRFEVRQGRLAFRGKDAQGQEIFEQKRVDLMLGLDLAVLSAKRLITYAFLLAGDSDLIPAISVAKSEGVRIYLVHGKACHDDLLDEADERIELSAEFLGRARKML